MRTSTLLLKRFALIAVLVGFYIFFFNQPRTNCSTALNCPTPHHEKKAISLNDIERSLKISQTTHAAKVIDDIKALKMKARVAESGFDVITQNAALTHGIDANLLRAIILVESNYKVRAISHMGAAGLMQITEDTARKLGIIDRYDPVQNIHGGAKYIKKLLTMFDNNLKLALAAYNAGPGAVLKYKGIPPYEQTRSYVQKVLVTYETMQIAHAA